MFVDKVAKIFVNELGFRVRVCLCQCCSNDFCPDQDDLIAFRPLWFYCFTAVLTQESSSIDSHYENLF